MHADRTNRAALVLLALLLIAAGAVAGLIGFGLLDAVAPAQDTMLDNAAARFVGDNGAWFWPVVAVLALLLAWLALRWLLALSFSTDRVGELPVQGDPSGGRSTLSASALSRAVVAEVTDYRGVHSATARIIGDSEAPELVLEVTLEESTDFAAVRRRIETEAVAHARQAMDLPGLPVIVDLTVTTRQDSRVA